jgi:hypothetical protein
MNRFLFSFLRLLRGRLCRLKLKIHRNVVSDLLGFYLGLLIDTMSLLVKELKELLSSIQVRVPNLSQFSLREIKFLYSCPIFSFLFLLFALLEFVFDDSMYCLLCLKFYSSSLMGVNEAIRFELLRPLLLVVSLIEYICTINDTQCL